jgi:hypothetical protein
MGRKYPTPMVLQGTMTLFPGFQFFPARQVPSTQNVIRRGVRGETTVGAMFGTFAGKIRQQLRLPIWSFGFITNLRAKLLEKVEKNILHRKKQTS